MPQRRRLHGTEGPFHVTARGNRGQVIFFDNGDRSRFVKLLSRVTGHLFRHRFYAGLVSGDSHLVELMRYLALNPVNAGLCDKPAEWPWSSYRMLLSPDRGRLLSDRALAYFGSEAGRAREAFRQFVEEQS